MKNRCCKDCENQEIGCHSTCVKYFAETLVAEQEKERIKKGQRTEHEFNDYRASIYKGVKKR